VALQRMRSHRGEQLLLQMRPKISFLKDTSGDSSTFLLLLRHSMKRPNQNYECIPLTRTAYPKADTSLWSIIVDTEDRQMISNITVACCLRGIMKSIILNEIMSSVGSAEEVTC